MTTPESTRRPRTSKPPTLRDRRAPAPAAKDTAANLAKSGTARTSRTTASTRKEAAQGKPKGRRQPRLQDLPTWCIEARDMILAFLRDEFLRRGISLSKAAEVAGFDKGAISRALHGQRAEIPWVNLAALLRVVEGRFVIVHRKTQEEVNLTSIRTTPIQPERGKNLPSDLLQQTQQLRTFIALQAKLTGESQVGFGDSCGIGQHPARLFVGEESTQPQNIHFRFVVALPVLWHLGYYVRVVTATGSFPLGQAG